MATLDDYYANFFGSDSGGPQPYVPPAIDNGSSLRITTPGGTGSEATLDQPGRVAVKKDDLPAPDPFAAQRAAYDASAPPAGPGSPTIPASYGGPLPPGQTPPPSYDQQVVYTDASGQGYTAAQLKAAQSNPAFMANPLNARTGDIVAQYGAVLNPAAGTGSGSGGGGNQTGTGGTGFADPAYQNLLDLVNQRLRGLQGPQSFPQLDQYMQMLTANEAAAKQRAQTFAGQLTTRVGQLQQPLMTDANVVQQHALASNDLIGQRDTALANARQNIATRGFAPTSGLGIDQANQIAQNYGNQQAQIDARLQQGNIATDEQRRNQATQLQGLAQQALQGGDLTALQNQAQNTDLENQLFNIKNNLANQTLAVGQIPVDLTNQGFANSLNASNSAANPLSSILGLLALGNQQQGIQQSGQNSNASGLGWILQQMFA